MLQTRNKNRLIWRGIVILALLTALPGTPVAAEQTFDEAVATYKRGDYATAMRGFRVYAEQGSAEAQVALWSSFAPPFSAARCSGVEPFLSRAFTLAPASRHAVTSSTVAASKNSCVFHC